MKVNVIYQNIKHQAKVNYVTFKTDVELSHTDDSGVVSKGRYLTKSADVLFKECGAMCGDVRTELTTHINDNIPEVHTLLAKAASQIVSLDVKETKVAANVIVEGHSETFPWIHHECKNGKEKALDSFTMHRYDIACDAFKKWCNDNIC